VVPFYSIYCNDGSSAAEESLRLARATGTPTIWACRDKWLEGAFFANAVKRNKPAVLVECGGGGPVPEEHVENFARAIEGVAQTLGILPGAAAPAPQYRTIDGCSIVYNQRGGYFEPSVQAGDIVAAGQTLGRILSPHGEVLEELLSPVGPAYIASILREFLPIHSGIEVAEAIQITDRRTA
jgi:predicted deacylase